jgi:hypothetical protein
MSSLKRAHLLMFTGGGIFGGGVVAMITQAHLLLTALLFGLGIGLQAWGMYIHWKIGNQR